MLERYGEAYVNTVADKDRLEHIVSIPQLRSLLITVMRPNPDTPDDDLDTELEERMRKLKARRYQERLDATAGQSLEPDEEAMTLARVATRNGEVEAIGRNQDGVTEIRSTKDHPMIEAERFDPEKTADKYVFRSLASRLIRRAASRSC
jgi:Domain of unknown function (DUF4747)